MHILLPYFTLFKGYKKTLILGIVLAIITLLANVGLITLSSWLLSISAIEGVNGICNFNYIIPAVGIRSLAIIRTVGRYFERLTNHDITFRILQHLRVDIFVKLLPLFPAKLTQFRQGDLLNRMIADIDTLNNLYLRTLLPIVSAFVVITIVMLWLSILDSVIALIFGIAISAVLLILSLLSFFSGRSIGKNLINLRSEYRQKLIIWLQNQAELIIFGANKDYILQIENAELNWYKAQYCQSKLATFFRALISLTSNLVILIILWVSASNVIDNYKSGVLIATYIFCALAVFEVLTPVAGACQHLGQVITSFLRITQIIKQDPEVHFIDNCLTVPSQVSLYLDHVSFTYKGCLQNTLKEVTLSVSAGTRVAILGRTGCGKTTLLQLITRAWDPQQGMIKINNILLNQFNEQTLRSTISMVPQHTHLFNSTLRNNLLLASPTVNDEKLYLVLEQVGLCKLLDCNGMNNWLGEGGRQLSAGELRRLAIARMLLHNAPLILLDEPTEGLDTITEKQIIDLLAKITYGKTVITVTHRLCGLDNYDTIIMMDNGQIIEQSKYSELLMKNYFCRYFK